MRVEVWDVDYAPLGQGILQSEEKIEMVLDGSRFEATTPVILLDTGQTILGCECWWKEII